MPWVIVCLVVVWESEEGEVWLEDKGRHTIAGRRRDSHELRRGRAFGGRVISVRIQWVTPPSRVAGIVVRYSSRSR